MEIILTKNAGFCFGVERAVSALREKNSDEKVVTLGPIIHNQSVVDELKDKGIDIIENISDAPKGYTVAIRAHGVSKSIINEMEEKGIPYMDLTCPFVKKNHQIVEREYNNGYRIVIAGDRNHPEIIGINGWCENTALMATDTKELEGKISPDDKVCLVAQTTLDRETFENIKNFIKKCCKKVLIFDTICSATAQRQDESAMIAKKADYMFVIGAGHSANSNKLSAICRKYCANVYQIACFEDIPQDIDIPKNSIVGITAGASTPPWMIKEVIGKMEEMLKDGEMSFAQALEEHEREKALVTLKTGDIVKGTVMSVEANGVSVNLGYKSDGFIPAGEFVDDPDADLKSLINVGDVVEVFVVRVNDVDGEVTLSKKKLDSIAGARKLEEAYENKEILEGKIVEVVNGGVLASVSGARVFIPAKLASDRYVEDLNSLMGLTVSFRIIEISKRRGRNKLVGSVKEVIKEQKAKLSEAFWAEAEVGKKYSGVVKSITNFGAFVDIGGVEGLVHISELSWSRIKHPSEIVKEGDVVEVYIIEMDKEKGKISLGYKKTEDNPWEKVKAEIEIGKDIPCKVVRIVPFGAFAEIFPGVDGLIHISQVANKRIGKVEDELTVGQHVTARVVELDLENKKIGLSIRAIIEEEEKANAPEEVAEAAEEAVEEVAETAEEVVEEVVEAAEETVEEAATEE